MTGKGVNFFSRRDVPDFNLAVRSAGDKIAVAGMKRNAVDEGSVPCERGVDVPGRGVIDADIPVGSRRGHPSAVGGKGDFGDIPVGGEDLDLARVGGIPDPSGVGAVAGQDPFAVRRPERRIGGAVMAGKGSDFLLRGDFPELDHPVAATAGSEVAPIGAKGQRSGEVGVRTKGAEFLSLHGVPHGDRAFGAGRGDEGTVPVELRIVNIPRVTGQLELLAAGQRIEERDFGIGASGREARPDRDDSGLAMRLEFDDASRVERIE